MGNLHNLYTRYLLWQSDELIGEQIVYPSFLFIYIHNM
jgi:hypothetical protein